MMNVLRSKWYQNSKCELLVCPKSPSRLIGVEIGGLTVSFSPCNTERKKDRILSAGVNFLPAASSGSGSRWGYLYPQEQALVF